jgi:PAS domain S-box-containing protein
MNKQPLPESKVKILVVEDELIIAKGIEKRLKALGYSVTDTVASGDEAVKLALEILPDLVLMDINLQGGMDGVTAAEQIRSQADIPVIFLTAYADSDTLARAKVSEPFGYIVKPFQDITLKSSIEMALYKHGMECRLRRSEQWLSTTLKSIGDGVIATNRGGIVSFVNTVAEGLTGWSQRDAVGRHLSEVFRYRERGTSFTIENLIATVIGGGVSFCLPEQTLLTARDGKEIPIEAKTTPICNDKGNILGLVLVFSDITRRVQTEEALRRSEWILSLKNQVANIFLTSPDEEMYGKVLAVVQEGLQSKYGIFGFVGERGDLIIPSLSHQVWDECSMDGKTIVFPREKWSGLWGKALTEKKSFFLNERFTVPQGHVAIENFLTVPILYRNQVIGLISVANKAEGYSESDRQLLEVMADRIAPILHARIERNREEKDRQRAEEELRKSEEFLRSVFDAIPDLFSIIDSEHRIVLSNWHGGYEYVPLLIRDSHPHCYQAYYGFDKVCEGCHTLEVFRTGKPVAVEKFNPRIGYVEIRSFPIFDEAGNVALVAEHVHDITARKVAEEALAGEKERLAVTLRSIGDGVVTTDTAGNVILLNKVAEELTGWCQEAAVGKHIDEVFAIISENTRQPLDNPVEKVLSSGCIVELVNHTVLVSRDGKERIIADSAAPIRDRESRIVGAVLVFRDITEKRRMEEELLKAQRLESIGILAGGIAHDFNNLLTAILGNISLSKMYVTEGDKLHKKLSEAEKASLRARDLTQQLLTFSRGGAPVKRTASIAEIIRDSTAFSLSGSKVTCTFAIPEDLWMVEVDEGQISQVINNIILNAEQAMPAGGVIEVTCRNVHVGEDDQLPIEEGRYILVAISDQGEGIPVEALPRIFDPYFTTKDGGKGLGLSTVYSIVKNHDGHITVSSQPGVGTTFTIYLPVADFTEQYGAQEEHAVGEFEEPLAKGTVLVMDDEENIRDVVAEMLSFIGYETVLSRDGTEAVSLYRQATNSGKPFAAVLMDLTIPGGMGGGEAMRILREIDPEVKGIVSSGYSNDPILSDYRSFGFQGIITKPYKIGELKDVLERVITG